MPKTKKVEVVQIQDGGLRVIGRGKDGEPTFMAEPSVVLEMQEAPPTVEELAAMSLTRIRVAPEVLALFKDAVEETD